MIITIFVIDKSGSIEGNYILKSIRALSLSRAAYLFAPIIIEICFPFVGTQAASIPSPLRAPTRAWAASAERGSSIGDETRISLIGIPTPIGADGKTVSCVVSPGYGHACISQPTPIKENAMLPAISSISTSAALVMQAWKGAPANCSSFWENRLPLSANVRGARNLVSANAASFARSFAAPAAFSAAPSFSFDRLRSSVWMRLSHIPNATSPTIPAATPISVNADNFKKILYGGSIHAMANSTATEIITNIPHHIPHLSHDDDASSNWLSAAYIVPRGKYHAGKNRLRTVLLAVIFWSLMYAILFAAIYL